MAAGSVAFLTEGSGNRVGAHIVTADGVTTIPARGGRAHVRALLHQVITAPRRDGGGGTALGEGIARLAWPSVRRGLAVVVSDFLSSEPWEPPMRLVGTRHELLAIEVLDPREMELPDVGRLVVADPEIGRRPRDPHQRRRASARGTRRRPRPSATRTPRPCGAPGPTTWSCAPTATGWSSSCGSWPCAAGASTTCAGRPRGPGRDAS